MSVKSGEFGRGGEIASNSVGDGCVYISQAAPGLVCRVRMHTNEDFHPYSTFSSTCRIVK